MISIGDSASQMHLCKILAIALPNFFKKTNISAQFVFSYDVNQGGLNLNMGFLPREATEQEYIILFDEIQKAEKLLINNYVVNNAGNFENIKQIIFKHKEEIAQIMTKNAQGK